MTCKNIQYRPLVCLGLRKLAIIFALALLTTASAEKKYECVRWRWTGDVYERKVYCVEWREKE